MELVHSGKKVSKLSKNIKISLDFQKKPEGKLYITNIYTGNKMKLSYNKKTKRVEFKTKELGKFVIMR